MHALSDSPGTQRKISLHPDPASHQGAESRGILLTANASRILHALGLKSDLASSSIQPQTRQIRSMKSGFLVAEQPLGRFIEDRYGAPVYSVAEDRLVALLDGAVRKTAVCIRPDSTPTKHPLADPASVELTIYTSATNPRALPGTRQIVCRSTLGPADKNLTRIVTWMGPGMQVDHFPISAEEVAISVICERNHATDRGAVCLDWTQVAGLPVQMDAHPMLQDLFNNAFDFWQRDVAEPIAMEWQTDSSICLGDAHQRLPPGLFQTTAVAIEDAWVLARFIAGYEEDLTGALTQFETFRHPRFERLSRQAQAQGKLYRETNSWAARRRNLALALYNRYLPEIQMQQLDWIYGYDCIKGFD
ncbi:MAG: hypothetical protein O3A63_18255 [Proteobacteria bacterium]|nr:hypothetical protein [Pseudomonadota bacterium]